MAALHCVRGCTRDGEHYADCPCQDPHHEHATVNPNAAAEPPAEWEVELLDQALAPVCVGCAGCIPRPAAPGLDVCWGDQRAADRALVELPDLWVDLAERPRLTGLSKAVDGEGDAPPEPLGSDQCTERSLIKSVLVTWCKVLEEDHHITVPDERTITATSRSIAAHHSDMARQARDAAHTALRPQPDGTAPDPTEYATMKAEETRHLPLAAAARDDRETGRDILRALCEHLARHSETLLAGPHAGHFVSDVTQAYRDGKRKANKSRRHVTITCDCGDTVTLPDSDDDEATCRNCGESGVRSWWVTHKSPPPPGPAALPELHTYLCRQGLHLTLRQLRGWADSGWITPVNGDEIRRGVPRKYDPIGSLRVAEHLLAQPRITRNPGAAA